MRGGATRPLHKGEIFMKIICTKEEYSQLIRICCICEVEYSCVGCPIGKFCGEPVSVCSGIENSATFEISDLNKALNDGIKDAQADLNVKCGGRNG